MKQKLIVVILSFFAFLLFFNSCKSTYPDKTLSDLTNPKREFRGAWIQTIWQEQYMKMNQKQMESYFTMMLDSLHSARINAVIFQVRPHADAFYKSDLEPWSKYLTGKQGKAPENNFDPLAYLVRECHKRNMELHAWINPYRVATSEGNLTDRNHLYYTQPERFVKYGTQIFFDPGNPENRKYICRIVKDIVNRYDVDAIHMDDYFYPYPIAGQVFDDDYSFGIYAKDQGFKSSQRADWRRNNVNLIVKELKNTIISTKPWVRFGISPFGIYRNKSNTKDGSGSDTNGLQNYDDLYADVKLWVEEGWIDYNIPQLYWEIGHSTADYNNLSLWWSRNVGKSHLYFGQDVTRSMNALGKSGKEQMYPKIDTSRSLSGVYGNSFWSGYNLIENYKGILNVLRNDLQKYPSLIPAYTGMHKKKPKDISGLIEEFTSTKHYLKWNENREKWNPETAQYYVVYRFEKGEKKNLDNATKIVTITRDNYIVLPYERGRNEYDYYVTAVDRFHNESKGKKITVKL